MGITGATLNGIRATRTRVNIPAWGCWFADVSLDGDHVISGEATLQIADLTCVGTVISGGPQQGRSSYRIVAGKGGWGKTLPAKAYANDAGVKLSTVLQDAANEAGETLGPVPQTRVGPAYTRRSSDDSGNPIPASRVLQELSPMSWYIDDAGVTQIGARPHSVYSGSATRTEPLNRATGKIVLASEQVAAIKPGISIDGITAVDVMHEVSASLGTRTTIWGPHLKGKLDAFRAMFDQLDPNRPYRGVTEYRVVTRSGSRLNLQPIRASLGMPNLERVPVRPGVSGCEAEVQLGSRVLVGFVDSDPARPYVTAFEDADGEGFLPTSITLAEGVLGAARMTDPVIAGPFAGTITAGSSKVRIG